MYHEFTAIGLSPWFRPNKEFNVDQFGDGIGTIVLEKSHNGAEILGSEQVEKGVPKVGYEIDRQISYRFNCTAYTSGTIKCRSR